jgi:RNA polymerase sigma-70 factor (ECF subfamily)
MVTRPSLSNESNPSKDTDETLMARLRDGDELALNALMDRWEQPVVGFATRYTNNRSDALELAQETFVRIYENRKRYRAKGKFSTWMFAIAANLCKNHARWKRRHPSVAQVTDGGVDVTESLPSTGQSPDAESVRADEADQVRRAVQELPHDLRTVVLLFEFEGLSHAEIADVLKCSPKAVESRLYRARKALRVSLGELFERNPEG